VGDASTSAVARAFAGLDTRKGPATRGQMVDIAARSARHVPKDLIEMYCEFGWGEGWIPPLPEDDDLEEDGYCYVRIHSPEELTNRVWDQYPTEYCIIGSDGGGLMIVHLREKGYGVVDDVGAEFLFVAKTLEGFFEATENDTWFDD